MMRSIFTIKVLLQLLLISLSSLDSVASIQTIDDQAQELEQLLPESVRSGFYNSLKISAVDFESDSDLSCSSLNPYSNVDYNLKSHELNINSSWLIFLSNCNRDSLRSTLRRALMYGIGVGLDKNTRLDPAFNRKFKLCRKEELRSSSGHRWPYKNCKEILRRRRSKKFYSGTSRYMNIAGWRSGVFGPKAFNTAHPRAINDFEFLSLTNNFAVNFEKFILDPEYSCRKPITADYFNKVFSHNAMANCNSSYQTLVMRNGKLNFHIIDLNRVYRIDYLLASGGGGAISSFGHSMFRVVMCAPTSVPYSPAEVGSDCIGDEAYHIVFSFRGLVDDLMTSMWKGLKGDYKSKLFIMPFSEIKAEYNIDQGRNLIAYPLNFNQEQVKEFVLRGLDLYWTYGSKYRFFTRNCATESLDLARFVARDKIKLQQSIRPYGVKNILKRANLVDDSNIQIFPADEEVNRSLYRWATNSNDSNLRDLDEGVRNYLYRTGPDEHRELFSKMDRLGGSPKARLARVSQFLLLEQATLRIWMRAAVNNVVNHLVGDDLASEPFLEFMSLLDPSNIVPLGYGIPLRSDIQINENMLMRIASDVEQSRGNLQKKHSVLSEFEAKVKGFEENIVFFEVERERLLEQAI